MRCRFFVKHVLQSGTTPERLQTGRLTTQRCPVRGTSCTLPIHVTFFWLTRRQARSGNGSLESKACPLIYPVTRKGLRGSQSRDCSKSAHEQFRTEPKPS